MAARWILALALFAPIGCSAQNGGPPPDANPPQAVQPANPSAPTQSSPGTSQPLPQQPPSAVSAPPLAQSEIDGKLQVFVYPANGQSPTQQSQDEQQCFGWAQSSAANQASPNTAQDSSTQQKPGAPVAGGSAKGAAAGAAIGAIAGDAGEGAAIGATGGAMAGARNRRKAKEQADQQKQAQQTAQQQQATDALRRAYGACMEPKGYSVK